MKRYLTILLFGTMAVVATSCGDSGNEPKTVDMNQEYDSLITELEGKIIPLYKELGLSYWNASISGKEEDYQLSADNEMKLNLILSDTALFQRIEKVKKSGQITDPVKMRELDMVYNTFLSKQIDTSLLNQITTLSNKIEQKFSTFRAEIGGKQYSDNEIEDILSSSSKTKEVEGAWTAVKELGPLVADDIKELVRLRNKVAQSLGFPNYHYMKLKLDDQNPEEIEKLFNELDSLTRGTFTELKGDIDKYLAKRFGIKEEELMPWHYQNRFFQEAPKIYNVDLDSYYKDQDLVALTGKFFKGLGLDADDIIQRSDLFEKPGKNQHAYCTDIDNEGDVRILCNVKPNYNWMNTMLHEFGHGVYDKYIDRDLPFFLREPAHTFTTEAIAMLFGRLASNPYWMQSMIGMEDAERDKIAEAGFQSLRLEQLVFSRWSQVMFRFEKALYENPEQDLNALWWSLVTQYQMVKMPEGRNMPDWATKVHIASSPCYYHNYLLGELLASQLHNHIVKNVLAKGDAPVAYTNETAVGSYLIEKVFKPGRKLYWNDMIEQATGEKLTAKYYSLQFVQ